MGFAEATMEQQVFRKGRHKFPSLLDYKIPTTLDTPEIETILIESPDPEGPFGAKEAGEGPLNPVVPAIANAVFDAIGVRIDETPITPDKILKALAEQRDASRAHGGESVRIGPMGHEDAQDNQRDALRRLAATPKPGKS